MLLHISWTQELVVVCLLLKQWVSQSWSWLSLFSPKLRTYCLLTTSPIIILQPLHLHWSMWCVSAVVCFRAPLKCDQTQQTAANGDFPVVLPFFFWHILCPSCCVVSWSPLLSVFLPLFLEWKRFYVLTWEFLVWYGHWYLDLYYYLLWDSWLLSRSKGTIDAYSNLLIGG